VLQKENENIGKLLHLGSYSNHLGFMLRGSLHQARNGRKEKPSDKRGVSYREADERASATGKVFLEDQRIKKEQQREGGGKEMMSR